MGEAFVVSGEMLGVPFVEVSLDFDDDDAAVVDDDAVEVDEFDDVAAVVGDVPIFSDDFFGTSTGFTCNNFSDDSSDDSSDEFFSSLYSDEPSKSFTIGITSLSSRTSLSFGWKWTGKESSEENCCMLISNCPSSPFITSPTSREVFWIFPPI